MENELMTIHNSLLVITRAGELRRLWCPFPVRVIKSVDLIYEGEVHMVISIRMAEIRCVYIIADVPYSATYLMILSEK